MNPQPDTYYSQLCLIIFLIVFGISYFTSKPKYKKSSLDYFELGYISEDLHPIYSILEIEERPIIATTPKSVISGKKPTTTIPNPPKQKPTIAKTSQFKQDKAKESLTELQSQCISALVSLGMKKTEAKKRMMQIFDKSSPNTIEEFIKEAFRNGHN